MREVLRILYWNIHGINSRVIGEKNTDQEFLKITQQYDIVCLSELHTDKAISLPGFVTKKQKFRKKQHKGPKIGGGIAVYIKQDIAKNFHLLPNNNNSDSIWLTTNPPNEKPTRIGFFYCSPENGKFNFFDTINGELESFGQELDTHIFGDFNARTRDEQETLSVDKFDEELGINTNIHEPPPRRNSEDMKIINKRGKELLDICKVNDLVIANGRTIGDLWGSYTCHQKTGSSVVDYLLTSFNARKHVLSFSIGTYMPNLSDHCSLQTTINIGCKLERQEFIGVDLQNLPNRYIWTLDDDAAFENKLKSDAFKQKVNNIMGEENNPDLVHKIHDLLTTAANEINVRKTRKKHKTDPPWFDNECKELKDVIRQHGKKLKKNPNDVSERVSLYVKKKRLSNLVRRNKFAYKKSIVDEMCQNLTSGAKKEYWNMLRKLDGPPDTTTYMHEQQLVEHFKNLLNDPRIPTSSVETPAPESPNNADNSGLLNRKITKKELEVAKKILRNGKSPGIDNLINEMIAPLVDLYPSLLLKLFNNILDNTWISQDWLLSIITALHKKGAKEDPDNYRGISLMSCMAKLFLTILNNRLTTFCLENKILTPSQLGFVGGNRTSDPHIILNSLVHKYCHQGKKKLFGCFVDFSKAFDSVPRDLLLEKLKNRGIDGKFFEIIKTIYSNDRAGIKFGDKFSSPFRTNRGVRQGCVLSPLLFNIFLSDIQNVFDHSGDNPIMNYEEISCLIWADDILILSETEQGLQNKLHALATYCKENKLEVNTDKTKTMIFTKSGRLLKNRFLFRKTELENVRSYKYLGFMVTPSGEIKSGLEDLRVRALRAMIKIRKSLGPLFRANIRNTLHLYNYMVKPILLYCSDFWGTLKHPKNSPIERVHISFLKQLLGVRQQTNTDGVHLECGSVPIIFNAIKSSIKNWERIRQHDCNDLLVATYEEATTNDLPWLTSIRNIFESNGMMETFLTAGSETRESERPNILLFQRLKDQFNQRALENIKESRKLRFYSLLKTTPGFEKYLTDITCMKHRVDLTRLRLSSHSLHIETGRHTATLREDRTCTLCVTNTVEDETHFLIKCPIYQDIRTENMPQTVMTDDIPDNDKAVKFLKSKDQSHVAYLIHEMLNHRGIMLDSQAIINNIIDRVETSISADTKIEKEVTKTLSQMISNVVKSEKLFKIENFDDKSLKMTIRKPILFYEIKDENVNGLTLLLSKMK